METLKNRKFDTYNTVCIHFFEMDNLKILYAEYSSTGKYTVFPYVVSKPILFSIHRSDQSDIPVLAD